MTVLVNFIKVAQPRVILKREASVEELLISSWSVGMSVGDYTDY